MTSRRPAPSDVAITMVVVLAQLLWPVPGSVPEPTGAASLAGDALAVLAGAVVAWRRVAPGPVAGVVVAATVLGAALVAMPPYVAPLVATWAAIVHLCPARRAAAVGAATAAGTAVALGVGALREPGAAEVAPTLLGALLLVTLAAALRRTRSDVADERRRAAEREAAAGERLRIARELHDLVGHGLSSVGVQAGTARVALDAGDVARARQALLAVEGASREALQEMRSLLGLLRSDADSSGARSAAPSLADVATLVARARQDGLDVRLAAPASYPAVREAVAVTAYRVVQEALTNARRHAWRSVVDVTVEVQDAVLHVEVRDRGATSRVDSAGTTRVGLVGLRERVTAVGGTFEAGRLDGSAGWTVRARLPL